MFLDTRATNSYCKHLEASFAASVKPLCVLLLIVTCSVTTRVKVSGVRELYSVGEGAEQGKGDLKSNLEGLI